MKLKLITLSIYCVTTATALHLNKKYDELEKWATNQQIGSPYDALHFKETVKAKENFIHIFKHNKSSQDIINCVRKLLSNIIINLQAPNESKEYIGIKDLNYKAYLKRYYAKVQAIMIRDHAAKAARKLMCEGKASSNDLLAQENYTKTLKEVEKSVKVFEYITDGIFQRTFEKNNRNISIGCKKKNSVDRFLISKYDIRRDNAQEDYPDNYQTCTSIGDPSF